MSYTKTTWSTGDTITATLANNWETQYQNALADIVAQANTWAQGQTFNSAATFKDGVIAQLANNAHAAADDISTYPNGLSTFWLQNDTTGGWPITTPYGFVVTHNIGGTCGYQEVVEMYTGTDSTVKTRRWFREERDSNNFWQPFQEVWTDANMPFLGGNQAVVKTNAVALHTDTRTIALTYTNGNLTQVQEKDGATVVKTTTLNYNGSQLSSVQVVAGGNTVTSTLNYNGDGTLGSVTKAVS